MQGDYTRSEDLVKTLETLLFRFRPAFGQERVFERAASLVLGTLFAFARKTMTQLLSGLGQIQEDWTAAYRLLSRGRFQPKLAAEILFACTLEHVPSQQPYTAVTDATYAYTAVTDATHVPRSSKKMPGTGWGRTLGSPPWSPGFSRMQRFENVSWLTPDQEGYRRAIPLQWLHAPTEKSVPSEDAPCREWEAGLSGMRWLREQLDKNGRPLQTLLVAADGSYDVNKLWQGLPERTVLVCRCAKNRKLFALPTAPVQPVRGARRKYGEQQPPPQQMRLERTSWTKLDIAVRGRMIRMKVRTAGPFLVQGAPDNPVFLLLVKGYHRRGPHVGKRLPPCQYLVNAIQQEGVWQLPLPLPELIALTWHRWEIEVCHREIKTSFGLGQMQCWSKLGSIVSVQFMAWAYSVLVLAGYIAWGGLLHAPPHQTAWWSRGKRWSVSTLLQAYRAQLWRGNAIHPVYPVTCNKGPDNRQWNWALTNAAMTSTRG